MTEERIVHTDDDAGGAAAGAATLIQTIVWSVAAMVCSSGCFVQCSSQAAAPMTRRSYVEGQSPHNWGKPYCRGLQAWEPSSAVAGRGATPGAIRVSTSAGTPSRR